MKAIAILINFSFMCMTAFHGTAALFDKQSDSLRTSLIELYTSEGCSSCPPADEWLGLLTNNAALWRDFVPVAFHVDYWDRLGWTDRFGSKAHTARQYAYAAAWETGSVYTPGFVLDGKEWKDWVRKTLPARSPDKPGILHVQETTPGNFTVSFATAGSGHDWTFHVAVLGFGLNSKVTAGENSGHRLGHDFVVLDFEEKQASSNEMDFHFKRADEVGASRLALAVWVSRAGELEPVQALGGWWDK